MVHAIDELQKMLWIPLLGSRTYAVDFDAQYRSGSPSR